MGDKLTKEQAAFLSLLTTEPTPRGGLPLADRAQDRVRQSCKRLGYAEYIGGWLNGKQHPMGWRITPKGRTALESVRETA
jgi:hypothetical protein